MSSGLSLSHGSLVYVGTSWLRSLFAKTLLARSAFRVSSCRSISTFERTTMNFTICEIIRKCQGNRFNLRPLGESPELCDVFISSDELRGSRHDWTASWP